MPKHHVIPPTPENMVLGYLDANTPPVLQVESGDSVTLTSFPAGGRESLPEASRVPADYMAALTALPPGPGPHFITGPIHVRGAQPGDTLQVDILDATPTMDWGFVAILPLLGTLPDEFTDYETIHPVIDRARGVCTLPWGTELPLDPFFGIIGVAPHWRPAGDPDRGRQQGRPYAAGQAFPAMTVGAARVGRPTSIGAPRACRWSRSSTHKDRCHCCPRGR